MRELAWDGYFNVRDLGGLPTALSPTGATQFGRVARGPRRELLTNEGWDAAGRWGLSTIVDLRCAYEIGRRDGDPSIDDNALAQFTLINAPTEDQDNVEFQEVCFPILDSPAYWAHNWRILPQLVRGALVAIADAETGVLIHCSAGRDRTGMISALLLANAGVPPEHIVDDYAESVRAMAGAVTHATTTDRQASWTAAEASAWIDEIAPIVYSVATDPGSAFDLIGVTQDERDRLRLLLTEP
jgi:protein-tyrosine phosphatase